MSLPIFLPPYRVEQLLTPQQVGEQIPWSLADYDLPQLWERCGYGMHCKVGIVDTGISTQHPDLTAAIDGAYSGRFRSVEDINGHGSHVAGIVAARRNQTGVVGVAPAAKLFVAKGLGDDGNGTSRDVAHAIRACVDAGCHVINCSLGAPQPDPLIEREVIRANQAGIIVICAAGNQGPDSKSWPAASPTTIANGAVDRSRQLAPFSSTSEVVDFVGPGVRILSTYRGSGYATLSGTSMSTPWLSGLAALLISWEVKNQTSQPTRGTRAFAERMRSACADLGRVGHDPSFGWGVPIPTQLFTNLPDPTTSPGVPDWSLLLGSFLAALLRALKG